MITKEMLDYIGLFSSEQLQYALRCHYAMFCNGIDPKSGYGLKDIKNLSKTVMVLLILKIVIECEMEFVSFKAWLNVKK